MNDLFMVIAFVGLAAVFSARLMNPRTGRIVFWAATSATCVCVFLMAYPPDWRSGLLMAVGIGCLIMIAAYVNTEFIVVGGKTYSLFADPGTIDDYGVGLTPAKTWWLAVLAVALLTTLGVFAVVDDTEAWIPVAAGVVIVFAAVSLGVRDALAGRPVAAGQKAQLALLTVGTLGFFAACYFGAYHVGRRRAARSPQ